MSEERYLTIRREVLTALADQRGGAEHRLSDAAELLDRLVLTEEMKEFLTLEGEVMLEE